MRSSNILMFGVRSHLEVGKALLDGKREDIAIFGGDALGTAVKDRSVVDLVMKML